MRCVLFFLLTFGLFSCSPVVETSEEFPNNAVFSESNAIHYLDRVIDHDHDNAEALFQRAKLGLRAGDDLKAKEDIVKALEVNPEDPDYLLLKARIDEGLGQYAEAIHTIEKLQKVKRFINTLDFELFASDLYLKTKNYNLAGYYLQSAAEKIPNHKDVLYQRAKLYASTYDTLKAMSFYKLVLAKDSLHEAALLHLSELYLRKRHSDTTLLYLAKLKSNKSLEYHLLVAEALKETKRIDSAAKHWEQALLLMPRNAQANYDLGKYYFAKGDLENANKHMSAVAENERTKLPGFYLLFVKINERLGNVELALSLYHKQNLADSALLPKQRIKKVSPNSIPSAKPDTSQPGQSGPK